MNIGWPEGILLALAFIEVGISLGRDGQPRPSQNHNFLLSLLGKSILIGLLYWGGFFA